MAHIVCLLNVEGDRATFTWREGGAAFEPYQLDRMVFSEFKDLAGEARAKLAELVNCALYAPETVNEAAYKLAKAGYDLYESMFDPAAGQQRDARQVRKWLETLAEQQQVDALEIVVESPWSLPWNIVYDRKPDRDAFASADHDKLECWRPFWGVRYNLCGGRSVNPLRQMPIYRDPHVVMVVDPEIRDGLPADQQARLADFAARHHLKPVHTIDDLETAVEEHRPDLLYWLSHAEPEALILSGEQLSPRKLRRLLRHDDDDEIGFGGLAFLNACQTAEGAGGDGSFFEALHSVGFAGMIGTEHQTIDQFANPLGLDFLEAFLERGEEVGSILFRLRGRVPLGLLYGTYCPPHIRVERGDAAKAIELEAVQVAGRVLGSAAPDPSIERKTGPLPDEPYRSLAYFDRSGRALFAGRNGDVRRFATLLDEAATRIVVLHGESGVGKSSFLHAGVIPFLEEECPGYQFVRIDREDSPDGDGNVLFMRATSDLMGQLAAAVCAFCERPYEYRNPLGEVVSVDLPGKLAALLGGARPTPESVRSELADDGALLGHILGTIGDSLPFAPILVVDQCEEIFTLATSPAELAAGRQALDAIRRTTTVPGDFRLILSLRTEYYGRIVDRLRRGLESAGSVREYLLTELSEESVTQAILRPTVDSPLPGTDEVPRTKYGFCFEKGVAEDIARRITRFSIQRRDSVLPLVQVVCSLLYRHVMNDQAVTGVRTIRADDLQALGGVEGGMRSHVEELLTGVTERSPQDRKPVQWLFTQLYVRQPDGTLTTALLPEDDVRDRWTGTMPFEALVEASRRARLLKVNSLRIGGGQERRYVSLGHDALAGIAADWEEELTRSARRRKLIGVISGVSAIALAITGLVLFGLLSRQQAMAALANEKQANVASLLSASASGVPDAASRLEREWAVKPLEAARDDESLSMIARVHAAFGLVHLGQPQDEFLVDRLAYVSFGEMSNLLQALSRDLAAPLVDKLAMTANLPLAAGGKSESPIPLVAEGSTDAAATCVKAAAVLLSLGYGDRLTSFDVRTTGSPEPRSRFVGDYHRWYGDLEHLKRAFESTEDPAVLSALCLALRYVDVKGRDAAVDLISSAYTEHPKAVVRAAAQSTGTAWDRSLEPLVANSSQSDRDWYVNSLGMTMVALPMDDDGLARFQWNDIKNKGPSLEVVLSRPYYVADTEVTVAQWKQFEPDRKPLAGHLDDADARRPAADLTFYHAIKFCNWLSVKEGLKECYELVEGTSNNWLCHFESDGYRLPTEAEWRYACRGGANTTYYFGEQVDLLDDYGWYVANAGGRTRPVATRIPNSFGLFDMHGNVLEWCWDWYIPVPRQEDFPDKRLPNNYSGPAKSYPPFRGRTACGGDYRGDAYDSIADDRGNFSAPDRQDYIGLRIVRTMPTSQ